MKTINNTKKVRSSAFIFALIANLLVSQAQTAHHVTVTDYEYTPSQLIVNPGDTVIWTNTQGLHNVNGTQASYPSNPESFGNDVGAGWTYIYVFNSPGTYDYQCDPHVNFGMVGQVIVSGKATITLNFSDMNPHIGQDLWLAVIDKESGTIIKRIKETVETSFSVILSDIKILSSYNIDFFTDHNQSGNYNPPPSDHAWRIEVENLEHDTTISFVHNTNFTDIAWQHMLTINFLGMNPHNGQNMWLNVVDRETDKEIGRLRTVVEPEFSLDIPGIEPGKKYRISFFADHNGNGKYDAPPTDHAWKIDLDDVVGDTVLIFTHNTDFEDIEWENRLKVRYSGMSPHVGQLFQLYLYDITDAAYVDTITINPIPNGDFDVESEMIIYGHSYNLDFFADLSGNGSYDQPPTDHAWRIQLMDVIGDTTVLFTHNTNFTDIFEQPTSLRPAKELETVQIYPNPARDFITLSGDDLPTGELHIRIMNNNGQMVKSVKLNHSVSPLILQINELQKGIYYLLIQQGGYRSYSKMVKSE